MIKYFYKLAASTMSVGFGFGLYLPRGCFCSRGIVFMDPGVAAGAAVAV